MDHLETLRIFCTVVEVRSFTRAAQILALPAPAISRAINELEERLGVQLFHRSTRHISVTDAANELFRGSTPLLAELDAVQTRVRHGISEPSGTLRIAAHTTATINVLGPLMTSFRTKNPLVQLDLTLLEKPVDLVEEGFDLGIIQPYMLGTQKAITRLLWRVPVLIVTSPEYLARRGPIISPMDLEDCDFIHWSPSIQSPTLKFQVDGEEVAISLKVAISTNNSLFRRDIVLNGYGVAAISAPVVEDDLHSCRLVQVLADYDLDDGERDLRIAYRDSPFMPMKTRAFIDHALGYFAHTRTIDK